MNAGWMSERPPAAAIVRLAVVVLVLDDGRVLRLLVGVRAGRLLSLQALVLGLCVDVLSRQSLVLPEEKLLGEAGIGGFHGAAVGGDFLADRRIGVRSTGLRDQKLFGLAEIAGDEIRRGRGGGVEQRG